MKIAVKKEEGRVPFGGFHYMTHPIPMKCDAECDIYRLMGYIIVAVEDSKGERLIKEAQDALKHQMEVAFLTEDALRLPPA